MDLSGHDADGGLHARGVDLDVHENAAGRAHAAQRNGRAAFESADGPVVVGLEVGSAAVNLARMFLSPKGR
jgi:hypothetical protein